MKILTPEKKIMNKRRMNTAQQN